MTIRVLLVFAFSVLAFSAFAADASTEIDVAVLKTDVARGELIAESDLEYKAIPQIRANASIVRAITDVAGMEARRALKAGELIRANDLKRPTLVAKGSTVTMLFDAPGMRLSAIGRALAEGAEGDTITVLNPTSYRKVEAVVIKAGTVRVGTLYVDAASTPSEEPAERLAARRP
jgi:flagella basal body P-ring formation protein FlgA